MKNIPPTIFFGESCDGVPKFALLHLLPRQGIQCEQGSLKRFDNSAADGKSLRRPQTAALVARAARRLPNEP